MGKKTKDKYSNIFNSFGEWIKKQRFCNKYEYINKDFLDWKRPGAYEFDYIKSWNKMIRSNVKYELKCFMDNKSLEYVRYLKKEFPNVYGKFSDSYVNGLVGCKLREGFIKVINLYAASVRSIALDKRNLNYVNPFAKLFSNSGYDIFSLNSLEDECFNITTFENKDADYINPFAKLFGTDICN